MPGESTGNTSIKGRQLRQGAAEQRARLRPLRNALQKTERSLEKQLGILEELQGQLADPTLYEAPNQSRLAELVRAEGTAKTEISALEEIWIEQQEALESAGG